MPDKGKQRGRDVTYTKETTHTTFVPDSTEDSTDTSAKNTVQQSEQGKGSESVKTVSTRETSREHSKDAKA